MHDFELILKRTRINKKDDLFLAEVPIPVGVTINPDLVMESGYVETSDPNTKVSREIWVLVKRYMILYSYHNSKS